MAMTANTKIFYSTINQAALDQRLYFLRTHRHLSLSLHLLFERNPKERREEDAERKWKRSASASIYGRLWSSIIRRTDRRGQRRLEFMTNQGRETNAPKPASIQAGSLYCLYTQKNLFFCFIPQIYTRRKKLNPTPGRGSSGRNAASIETLVFQRVYALCDLCRLHIMRLQYFVKSQLYRCCGLGGGWNRRGRD
jgi:hypothetical protein